MKRPGWRTLSASLSVMIAIAVTCVFSTHALAQKSDSPFAGRWDFDIESPRGISARWPGVTEKDSDFEVWYQPGGGHVYPVKDVHVNGAHMSLTVSPASKDHPPITWELEAKGERLVGEEKSGNSTTALTGVRAPELKRDAPKLDGPEAAIQRQRPLRMGADWRFRVEPLDSPGWHAGEHGSRRKSQDDAQIRRLQTAF